MLAEYLKEFRQSLEQLSLLPLRDRQDARQQIDCVRLDFPLLDERTVVAEEAEANAQRPLVPVLLYLVEQVVLDPRDVRRRREANDAAQVLLGAHPSHRVQLLAEHQQNRHRIAEVVRVVHVRAECRRLNALGYLHEVSDFIVLAESQSTQFDDNSTTIRRKRNANPLH